MISSYVESLVDVKQNNIFYLTSIGDAISLDIILPSLGDRSLEPKRYSVN